MVGDDAKVIKQMRRRRLAMLAAALGLVMVACTSTSEEPQPSVPEVLPSLTPSTEANEPEPEANESEPEADESEPEAVETTTVPDAGYLWSVGDCVDLGADAAAELPYAPYGEELLASCAAPHTHEVYFTATLSGGTNAPYPDDLNVELFDVCFVEFAELMGFSSSDSTLQVVLYWPDSEEWAAGERYHACVVYQPGTGLVYRPLVGSAANDPGDFRWEVSAGTCYGVVEVALLAASDTVSCTERHSLEMIGEAEPAPGEDDYPGREAMVGLAAEACDVRLTGYAAQTLDDLPVLTFPLPTLLTEGEWMAGARTVRCFAFAGSVEQGLLPGVGSLGEGTFVIVDVDEGLPA